MILSPAVGRRAVLAGAAMLAGCQATPQIAAGSGVEPSLGPDGTAYLLLQAPISSQSRSLFQTDMARLLALKPTGLTVLLSSPGGVLKEAQAMAAFVDQTQAQGVPVTMHNIAIVASAACYLFLAGQRRVSTARGQFLFHQASLTTSGAVTLTFQQVQELSRDTLATEQALISTLVSRTRLSAAEAGTFVHRTVILTAEEARRDGIIDSIAPVSVPPGIGSFAIRYVPGRPPATAPVGQAP